MRARDKAVSSRKNRGRDSLVGSCALLGALGGVVGYAFAGPRIIPTSLDGMTPRLVNQFSAVARDWLSREAGWSSNGGVSGSRSRPV